MKWKTAFCAVQLCLSPELLCLSKGKLAHDHLISIITHIQKRLRGKGQFWQLLNLSTKFGKSSCGLWRCCSVLVSHWCLYVSSVTLELLQKLAFVRVHVLHMHCKRVLAGSSTGRRDSGTAGAAPGFAVIASVRRRAVTLYSPSAPSPPFLLCPHSMPLLFTYSDFIPYLIPLDSPFQPLSKH